MSIYYEVSEEVMARGEGIRLFDSTGKSYIDCAAGTFNLVLGYTNHEVISAVKDQADRLIHATSSFQTTPINDMVRRLLEVAPKNMSRVHPKTCSGSTANEGAIKMAQNATGNRDIITMFRSHLGQTMMMASLSGNAFRKEPFPTLFPGALVVPDPYCYRCFYNQKSGTCGFMCVERINDFIQYASTGKVAAIMTEPISGNGGNIVPPRRYFQALKKLCDENGIALILDEIQTGFGRTGRMFAAEYFNVEPHIMTVAKGLGGTGFQVAAILTEEKYAGLPSTHHSFTFGSNVLAAAAAAKMLEVVVRPGFLTNVQKVGDYIMCRLWEMKKRFRFIGDVRGIGLMIGVEIVDSSGGKDVALTNKIAKEAMRHGLILRTSQYGHGNVFKIRPALIITPDEAVELCDKLEDCLAGVEPRASVRASGRREMALVAA
jgi:4-aminobutyrate aminotransferase